MFAVERRKYYLLALLTVIYITGLMGAKVLVPLLAYQLDTSPTEIGFIAALYSFFPLLFVVYIGKWIDRVGSKLPIILSTFIGTLSLSIPFFTEHIIGLYLLQIVSGLTQTVFAVAAQNYMGNTGQKENRENNIAIFSIAVSLGSFFGPLLAGALSDWFNYSYAFIILSFISFLSGILALLLYDIKEISVNKKEKRSRNNSFELLRVSNIRRAFLMSAIILLGKEIYITYFPLLALEYGLSNKTIGMIVSANALAGVFIRGLMPRLVDRLGRNKVIFSSVILSGLLFIAIPLFKDAILLAAVSFILGLGLGIGQPLSITTTIMALPKNRVGEGLGLRISVNRFTQVLAPISFGTLADYHGYSIVFWSVGILILVGSFKVKIEELSGVENEK